MFYIYCIKLQKKYNYLYIGHEFAYPLFSLFTKNSRFVFPTVKCVLNVICPFETWISVKFTDCKTQYPNKQRNHIKDRRNPINRFKLATGIPEFWRYVAICWSSDAFDSACFGDRACLAPLFLWRPFSISLLKFSKISLKNYRIYSQNWTRLIPTKKIIVVVLLLSASLHLSSNFGH